MTETATPTQNAPGNRDIGIIAVVIVVILGGLWLLSGGQERPLARSATGFDGLTHWLKAGGTDARSFTGGGQLVQDDIALRILPLHDTDLTQEAEPPQNREAVIAQTTERDIYQWVVQRKLSSLPTLVVLPKWRGGMRRLGVAHKDLLTPTVELNRLLRQLGLDGARIKRDPAGWDTAVPGKGPADNTEIGLLHRQTFRADACEPLIGTADAMLLAKCPLAPDARTATPGKAATDGTGDAAEETLETQVEQLWRRNLDAEDVFFVLADPDLMNNHGLTRSENARAARQIIANVAIEGPVIIDQTTRTFTVADDWQAQHRDRTWNDFARMFRWPFTMIWIAFGLFAALVLWRSVMRYGPLARAYSETPRASKEISIDAKARLLRLANHDDALLSAHVASRLAYLAAELMGPHWRSDQPPLETLQRLIRARDADLATALGVASDIPTGLAPQDIILRLDQFETCYDKVIHDFGRTASAG